MIEGIVLFSTVILFGVIIMQMRQIDRMEARHSQERQLLLDRIQARDLPEYKALETQSKPKPIKEPKEKLAQV
jgi:hypothetical protein